MDEPIVPADNTALPNESQKDIAQIEKDRDSALAQKQHWREKAEKAEADRIALEKKLNERPSTTDPAKLEVADFIDISASLDGLDPREKAFLAEQHTLSKKSLKDIRESEDFQLWQSAYRTKQEKERALKPDSTQTTEAPPKTLNQRLAAADLAEKETILKEAGLYRDPRPRGDRTNIGNTRTR